MARCLSEDLRVRVIEAVEAGADAVGLFTGFITRGPTLPRRIGLKYLVAPAVVAVTS